MRKTKRGFTIVELVIVIAVIGVLTAVLVPTFIHLSNKAKKASDESLVHNLNTALSIEYATKKAPETMHDAIEGLEHQGFVADILVAKSEQDLVYSLEKNRFALSDDEEVAEGPSWWKIVEKESKIEGNWSFYAARNFVVDDKAEDTDEKIVVKAGFDAGVAEIANIEYDRHEVTDPALKRTSVLRTNGGSLKVNAPVDKVKHYGKADALNIEAIAPTSYHEFDEVGYVKIANGRLVVEESAKIEGVYLVANESGEFDGIKLAVVGDATLPEVSRADVELNDGESKLVVEVQTLATSEGVDTHPEYVWLSKSGSDVSTSVSSSSETKDAVVEEPSQAAAVVKEEAKESAQEIDENSEVRIGARGYATLVDAITVVNTSGNGGKISVLQDIDFSTETYSSYYWKGSNYQPLEIKSDDVTLDLQGHTFSEMGNCGIALGNLLSKDGRTANLVVENGSLRVGKTDGVNNSYAIIVCGCDNTIIRNMNLFGGVNVCSQTDNLIIENCVVQGTKYYTVCSQTGSTVTIKGNSFGKYTDATVANTSMFWVQGASSDSDCITTENPTGAFGASRIDLLDGNYNVTVGGKFYLGSGLAPVVKGGTFNFDPTTYVAEGFAVVDNGNGTYSVVRG